MSKTISVEEYAKKNNFTLDWVYRLIKTEKIQAKKVNRKWQIEAKQPGRGLS